MTNSQRDYSNYLTRLARTSTKTIRELHSEKLVREVGKSYGLSESEMDQVVKEMEVVSYVTDEEFVDYGKGVR